jgi:hypothetical protein
MQMIAFRINSFICNIEVSYFMFENINLALYVLAGFVVAYIGLELAWHFTACRIRDKKIKPCLFKQVKTMLLVNHR